MLAISRALMSSPKLVLLDEPSLGLSPRVVEEVADLVRAINFDSGVSIILVEQNVALGLQLADWVYMLNQGEVVRSGSGAQMRADTDLVSAYLG
jgi:branched-chain amino acid transport system ATP-binding protein